MDEKSIIKRLNAADENAFSILYDKYVGMVYNYIRSLIRDDNQAEELTQVCFVQIWEHRQTISAEKNFPAYLYVTARNAVYKEIRRQLAAARFNENFSADMPKFHDSPEEFESWDIKRMQKTMEAGIDALPEARKKIYIMKVYQGKSIKEIAGILDISPKTVENQLVAARKFLRKRLSDFLLILAFLSINI